MNDTKKEKSGRLLQNIMRHRRLLRILFVLGLLLGALELIGNIDTIFFPDYTQTFVSIFYLAIAAVLISLGKLIIIVPLMVIVGGCSGLALARSALSKRTKILYLFLGCFLLAWGVVDSVLAIMRYYN